jgi:hypothetical protein
MPDIAASVEKRHTSAARTVFAVCVPDDRSGRIKAYVAGGDMMLQSTQQEVAQANIFAA